MLALAFSHQSERECFELRFEISVRFLFLPNRNRCQKNTVTKVVLLSRWWIFLFLATQVDMLIIFETQRIDVAILKFELKSVGF